MDSNPVYFCHYFFSFFVVVSVVVLFFLLEHWAKNKQKTKPKETRTTVTEINSLNLFFVFSSF